MRCPSPPSFPDVLGSNIVEVYSRPQSQLDWQFAPHSRTNGTHAAIDGHPGGTPRQEFCEKYNIGAVLGLEKPAGAAQPLTFDGGLQVGGAAQNCATKHRDTGR